MSTNSIENNQTINMFQRQSKKSLLMQERSELMDNLHNIQIILFIIHLNKQLSFRNKIPLFSHAILKITAIQHNTMDTIIITLHMSFLATYRLFLVIILTFKVQVLHVINSYNEKWYIHNQGVHNLFVLLAQFCFKTCVSHPKFLLNNFP